MKSNWLFFICIETLLLLLSQVHADTYYSSLPYENAMFNDLEAYGRHVADSQGMKLLIVGNVTDFRAVYCLSYSSEKQIFLEEGKSFANSSLTNFLRMLNASSKVRAYAEKANNNYYSINYFPKPDIVGLKIAFWDKEVNRPKPPYLAEILFAGNYFHYYQADPETQELRLVYKESYEDAMKGISG